MKLFGFLGGPHPAMFSGCSWLLNTQELFLVLLEGSYGMLDINLGSATCKASSLPAVLWLWFPQNQLIKEKTIKPVDVILLTKPFQVSCWVTFEICTGGEIFVLCKLRLNSIWETLLCGSMHLIIQPFSWGACGNGSIQMSKRLWESKYVYTAFIKLGEEFREMYNG